MTWMRNAALAAAASGLLAPQVGARTPKEPTTVESEQPGVRIKSEFVSTANALLDKLGDTTKSSSLPGATDPTVRSYVAQTKVLTRTLGTPAVPAEDVNEVSSLCGPGIRVLVGYLLAGTGNQAAAKDTPPEELAAKLKELGGKNVLRYPEVVLPGALFVEHCMAAYMPSVEATLAPVPKERYNDQVRHGVAEIHKGDGDVIDGALTDIRDPGLSVEFRRQSLDQLEIDWDNLVLALSSAQRTELAHRLSDPGEDVIGARLKRLRERIGTVKCGALCQA